MANPIEGIKRVPWEVWVGLGLTVLVAWWTTKSSISAGQATASGVVASQAGTGPGTEAGIGQDIGTYQTQTLSAIEQLGESQTSGFAGVNAAIGNPNDVTAGNQQTLFGQLGAANSSIASGFANVSSGLGAIQQNTDTLPALGSSMASLQAQEAANAQGIAGVQGGIAGLSGQLADTEQGLGGSIGTQKAETLALANALGQGGTVLQTLRSRGDYTSA